MRSNRRIVEVIAVDDGSTDDSREIIARFDSRVLPIFKPNGGQGSAKNRRLREDLRSRACPGVGDADIGRRVLGCCGRLPHTRGGFIGHVQRLDEPLGLTEARPNDSDVFATAGGWPKDCARRFDGRNAN